MSKGASVGTALNVNGTKVGNLNSISGIEITADTIDVTDFDNTSGYREKLAGFKDGGEVTASGFLNGDDEGQALCLTLLESGASASCTIVFPSTIGMTWSFTGVVTKFSTTADLEDAVKFDISIAVSGKPTLAASA